MRICSLTTFPGAIPRAPVKKGMEEEGEGKGRARKWKEGRSSDGGRRGKYGERRDGRSPFHKS
jgi:hypothetical protein